MKYDIIDEYKIKHDYNYLYDVINYTLEKEKATDAIFSIIFVDEKTIQTINKDYRNKDSVTDVISFAFEDNGIINNKVRVLGDIYVCIPKMESQAKEYGHTINYELAFLCVHGLLHLLGYDHVNNKEEEKVMFDLQEQILDEMGVM